MAKEINKFFEAALEGSEAIADSLTNNEMIKNIPVVGTALKIASGYRDLRDRIFISKIQRFIQGAENVTECLKLKEEVIHDEELMTKTGETVILVLDRLSDLKKAELVGFYFRYFLGGEIDERQFRRIVAAIENSFVDDMIEFLRSGLDELLSQSSWMAALLNSGITTLSAGRTYDDMGEIFYEASSMGRQMYEAWHEYHQN